MRRSRRRLMVLLVTGATTLALAVPAAQAGTANSGLPRAGANPIANMTWGASHDDDLWNAYQSASIAHKALLAPLVRTPRAVWLGYWTPTGQVRADTAAIVQASQNGNPKALTELATFLLNLVSQYGRGDRRRAGDGDRAG
jgi:hypothetical protein